MVAWSLKALLQHHIPNSITTPYHELLDLCTMFGLSLKPYEIDNPQQTCHLLFSLDPNLQTNPFGGLSLAEGSGGHGHLLIFQEGYFASICDHTFGEKEGDVACRQMGYSRAIGVVRNS